MAKTGYLITVYQDINPSSPTYNTTREERLQDETNCPITPQERWVVVEDETICDGFDKHAVEKKQQSIDGGVTWTDTTETRKGEVIERNCVECGYVPRYAEQYLTIESLEDNNEIKIQPPVTDAFMGNYPFYYSTDEGATWMKFDELCNENYPTSITTINNGQKLLLRADRDRYGTESNKYIFYTSKNCNIYGNIMSMLESLNFVTRLNTHYAGQFNGFFSGCKVVSAENLVLPSILAGYDFVSMFNGCTSLVNAPVLPATTLTNNCYASMFKGCTSLVNAPELNAATLTRYCYYFMFNGCTSLNNIKCIATDISAAYCTERWVYGVASSGTFTKNNQTEWTTGTSGIPSGWTVINE